jgi:hypothetical protein
MIPLVRAPTSLHPQLVAVAHHQMGQLIQTLPSCHALMPEPWQIRDGEILQEQPPKPHTMIGDNIVVEPGCSFQGSGNIVIGCGTKIGAHVTIATGNKVRGGIHSNHDTQIHIGGGNHIGEGCIIETRVQ